MFSDCVRVFEKEKFLKSRIWTARHSLVSGSWAIVSKTFQIAVWFSRNQQLQSSVPCCCDYCQYTSYYFVSVGFDSLEAWIFLQIQSMEQMLIRLSVVTSYSWIDRSQKQTCVLISKCEERSVRLETIALLFLLCEHNVSYYKPLCSFRLHLILDCNWRKQVFPLWRAWDSERQTSPHPSCSW